MESTYQLLLCVCVCVNDYIYVLLYYTGYSYMFHIRITPQYTVYGYRPCKKFECYLQQPAGYISIAAKMCATHSSVSTCFSAGPLTTHTDCCVTFCLHWTQSLLL